jgi:hypothetical protein
METDTMDLTISTRAECLDWIARWLRATRIDILSVRCRAGGGFAGRSDHGDIFVALQQKCGGS